MASASASAIERNAGLVRAIDNAADDLGIFDAEHKFEKKEILIKELRRRGRGDVNDTIATLTLIDIDGVLYWRGGSSATMVTGRRYRRAAGNLVEGEIVTQRRFELLEPDKVNAALQKLDDRFTPERGLRRYVKGKLAKVGAGPFSGRTLLLVHGTFSNSDNMIAEFHATPEGKNFLTRASGLYDQILTFDHPTLAVGPLMNAIDLSRLLAGSKHKLDIVAHSRGGVVVRWFLELFGNGAGPQPRAVLVGSPIAGTSLAAGPRIRGAIDLMTNIGAALENVMGLAAAANPFLIAPAALLRIFVSVTGVAAKLPIADAAIAMVPGLYGQSAIGNNGEFRRLREGPAVMRPEYFAVRSNFEPQSEGWKFWRYFRKTTLLNPLADVVFDGHNDLVVDSDFMTDFGASGVTLKTTWDYGTSGEVHHCNYFRQKGTLDFIANSLRIP